MSTLNGSTTCDESTKNGSIVWDGKQFPTLEPPSDASEELTNACLSLLSRDLSKVSRMPTAQVTATIASMRTILRAALPDNDPDYAAFESILAEHQTIERDEFNPYRTLAEGDEREKKLKELKIEAIEKGRKFLAERKDFRRETAEQTYERLVKEEERFMAWFNNPTTREERHDTTTRGLT